MLSVLSLEYKARSVSAQGDTENSSEELCPKCVSFSPHTGNTGPACQHPQSRPLRFKEMNPSFTIRFGKLETLRLTQLAYSPLPGQELPPDSATTSHPHWDPTCQTLLACISSDVMLCSARGQKETQRKGKTSCAAVEMWGWKIPHARWDPLVWMFLSHLLPTSRFLTVRNS